MPEEEHYFAKPRLWRFDMAWPDLKLYVEVEGGAWGRSVVCNHCHQPVFRFVKGGRKVPVREGLSHTSGPQYAKNLEKYNMAALLGWRGIRFQTNMIRDGSALGTLRAFFSGEPISPGGQLNMFDAKTKIS